MLVILILLIGFFIGQNSHQQEKGITTIIFNNDNKLSEILGIVGNKYVDEADIDSLIEASIPKVLEELDPHSTYIAKDDVEASAARPSVSPLWRIWTWPLSCSPLPTTAVPSLTW